MRLTAYTDFALRTLMYLATNRDSLATIGQIADEHGIAKNHLTKVVHQLGLLGFVETVRGRNGGLRLARDPEHITIGEVVRQTETDFHMAACFDDQSAGCILASACGLKGTLGRATQAFLAVLDDATLKAMVVREEHKKRAPGAPQTLQLHYQPQKRAKP